MRAIWQFLAHRPIVAISTPLVIGLGVQAAFKIPSEWLDPFVRAAGVFFAGGDIYYASKYTYPPFMAMMVVPFVSLPDVASRLAWFAINVACIAGMVRSAWLLASGATLPATGPARKRELFIAAIGIICSAPYILNALAHQQIDLMIDFLIVAGCLLLVRGDGVVGAVLIGLAVAFKGPPLLFAAYLVFRRNWVAAGLIILVSVGANILPDLIVSPPDGKLRLASWIERFVVPTFSEQIGAWNGVSGFNEYNQSLAGTLKRLFTTALQSSPSRFVVVTNSRNVSEALIKFSAYGLMLTLLATSIIASLRGQSLARVATCGRSFPSQTALELSAVSALMLLMSPMSDLAHLGILILPAFCLARIAVFTSDRAISATLIVAAAGALSVNKDLIGDTAYMVALWIGMATLSTLALWVGCIIALFRGCVEPPVFGLAESIFLPPRHRDAALL
jgi:hypothetical protein